MGRAPSREDPPRDLRGRVLRGTRQEMAVLSFTVEARNVLTEAERDTAIAACRGLSNAEISAQRGVSVRTVANQLASLFQKLGIRSRAELAARFGVADLI